jgi:amino-acid N-acetyltransferase
VTAIEPARMSDFDAIAKLLDESRLPTAGLRDSLPNALVARENGTVVGAAALERYRSGALLRSVVVAEPMRGRRLGERLTRAALDLAREHDAPAAFLLTTTAPEFFSRFGFETITRGEVPDDVRQSIEFSSACPASAIAMKLDLTPASRAESRRPSARR